MDFDGRKRVVIDRIYPEIDSGSFPIKRIPDEKVNVRADIFTDGHDKIRADLIYWKEGDKEKSRVPMRLRANDEWHASFTPKEIGIYKYTVEAWIDSFETLLETIRKKSQASQDIKVEIMICAEYLKEVSKRVKEPDKKVIDHFAGLFEKSDPGKVLFAFKDEEFAEIIRKYPDKELSTEYHRELSVLVDRKKALFSSWYEFFPRSCTDSPGKHGTFNECRKLLPDIAEMGFDVIYMPPIHPIGLTKRKGKNNNPDSAPGEPGSPWAIGSKEGGHKSVHPELGTVKDFENFVSKASGYGIEVALDIAFQCSPDHPYVKEHPQWFRWRPDGTVQYAENPPKKYEDIIPLDFESEDWKNLWQELKSVFDFWIDKGIKIFRVDNPHTKAFPFWHWVISGIKKENPDVIFLAEAFTRPKLMYRLAKCGFTQSYTYFTWRNTKKELTEYINELTGTEVREFFRPNFWSNTPDILPEYLQYGGRPAFIARVILAATLSSNYGVYGPVYELCLSEALSDKEEYKNSEKYEIKQWQRDNDSSLKELIAKINRIRKENRALHTPWNIKFCESENENIILYAKYDDDLENIVLVAVNLNPYHTQAGRIKIPLDELSLPKDEHYLVHDVLKDEKYVWQGEWNYIELDPKVLPAHIFVVRKRLKRENDFDYFL